MAEDLEALGRMDFLGRHLSLQRPALILRKKYKPSPVVNRFPNKGKSSPPEGTGDSQEVPPHV